MLNYQPNVLGNLTRPMKMQKPEIAAPAFRLTASLGLQLFIIVILMLLFNLKFAFSIQLARFVS